MPDEMCNQSVPGCILQARTIVRPGTTVPSVNMLALHLHFGVRNEVKMLPSFLRCFPNVETLCIEVESNPPFPALVVSSIIITALHQIVASVLHSALLVYGIYQCLLQSSKN